MTKLFASIPATLRWLTVPAAACCLTTNGLAQTASEVVAATKMTAGLAIHLGTTDGALEAGLAEDGHRLVHGLAIEAASLDRARTVIRAQGLYGLASVARWDSLLALPYGDNLANLLVADLDALAAKGLSEPEVLRVLAPHGMAYVKRRGQWTVLRKPRPAELDDWTHYDYGPEGNAVSKDRQVGPATTVKWLDGYRWVGYAHRESSGFRAAGDLLVQEFRFDKLPSLLLGRDAFNGLVRWQTDRGGAAEDGLPMTLHDGRLYTHIAPARNQPAPLVALDLATGQIVHTFAAAAPITDFKKGREAWKSVRLLAWGDTVVHVNGRTLVGLEPKHGRLKWQHTHARPLLFAVSSPAEQKVFAVETAENARSHWSRWPGAEADAVVCFDATTGQLLWRNAGSAGSAIGQLVYARGHLLFFQPIGIGAFGHDGRFEKPVVGVLRASDGELLWQRNYREDHPKGSFPGFLFSAVIREGTAYLMNQNRFLPYDLATGQPQPAFDPASVNNRCVRPRATENFFLIGFGIYAEPGGRWTFQNIGRSDCATGLFPANGMTYQTPNDCHCFAQLRGFAGLASGPLLEPVPDSQRLEQGHGRPNHVSETVVPRPEPETVLIGNSLRRLPPQPFRVRRQTGSPIRDSWHNNDALPWPETEAATVEDRQYVAVVNEHRVEAREGNRVVWTFTTDARISGPPLPQEDRVFVAAHDGYVYCLNAADGALRWRFLAASARRWMVAYGQLESVAPVFGVVLHHGDLWCSAGRHPELDGGITIWRLEPATGRIKNKKTLHRAIQWAAPADRTFAGLQNFVVNGALRVVDGKLMLHGHELEILDSPTRIYKTSCPIEPYAQSQK